MKAKSKSNKINNVWQGGDFDIFKNVSLVLNHRALGIVETDVNGIAHTLGMLKSSRDFWRELQTFLTLDSRRVHQFHANPTRPVGQRHPWR